MNIRHLSPAALALAFLASVTQAQPTAVPTAHFQVRQSAAGIASATPTKHVLLISVDGLHAADLASYIAANPNSNLAKLAAAGVVFPNANTTRPSDSFPGLMALVTGGSPKSEGVYYDVGYDRNDLPPTNQGFILGTDPTSAGPGSFDYVGINNPSFTAGLAIPGTEAEFDEFIEKDFRRLDGGGGVDPTRLPRDPNTLNPVLPANFGRDTTIFQVAHANGLVTAWSDKHVAAYAIVSGPDGTATVANPTPNITDYYSPEIAAYIAVVPATPDANATTFNPALVDGRGLYSVVDPSNAPAITQNDPNFAGDNSTGTSSILNVEGYDDLKVRALLNEIDGLDHTGTVAQSTPAIFGMNFQVVSVGEKLKTEPSPVAGAAADPFTNEHGGYVNSGAAPGPLLAEALRYTDDRLGKLAAELTKQGLMGSTTIIVTAKHGQSPTDIDTLRMKAKGTTNSPNGPVMQSPADDLGGTVAHAIEDDISLLWLQPGANTAAAVNQLNGDRAADAIQAIFFGPLLNVTFGNPATDPRTPSIIVQPDPGVIYSGSQAKVAEHGGFSNDDINVALLVSGAAVTAPGTVNAQLVRTTQVAPTILKVLGLNPQSLTGVVAEKTQTLPGF